MPAPAPVTSAVRPAWSIEMLIFRSPGHVGQQAQHLVDHSVCPIQDGCLGDPADRVFHRDDPEARQAQVGGGLVGEEAEFSGGHQHGGDAGAFQLHGVVDTPRRAAPSISSAGEDQLHLLHESTEYLVLAWDGGVLGLDEGHLGARAGGKPLGQSCQEEAGVGLAVVEDADPPAGQHSGGGSQAGRRGARGAGGWVYLHGCS